MQDNGIMGEAGYSQIDSRFAWSIPILDLDGEEMDEAANSAPIFPI